MKLLPAVSDTPRCRKIKYKGEEPVIQFSIILKKVNPWFRMSERL